MTAENHVTDDVRPERLGGEAFRLKLFTVVSALVGQGRALPLESYVDPWLFELEQERIFRADWVFVGTEADLPELNDYRPLTIGGQPVLLLRHADGDLRAISNLCAHRGTLLIDEPGNANHFKCPNHAWTYSQDGALLGATLAPEVDRGSHCLPRYRVESWHGLVFVSLSPSVQPLAERLAPIVGELDDFHLHALHPQPSNDIEEEWDANWKLIYSNAAEGYHVFRVHPETLEPYFPTKLMYYVLGNAFCTLTGGVMRDGKKGQSRGDFRLVFIPPSLVFLLDGESLQWQAVEPLTPGRSRVRAGALFLGEPSQVASRTSDTKAIANWETALQNIFLEDRAICERGQRGATGHFEPGTLTRFEHGIEDFHHYLGVHLFGEVPRPVRWGAPLSAERLERVSEWYGNLTGSC